MKLRIFVRWLRSHPLIVLFGVFSTVVGILKGLMPALEAFTAVLGVPACFSYADKYTYSTGHFQRDGKHWTEVNEAEYRFVETHRDRNYIILLNITPRVGNPPTMILRIPVCGGTLQWTYQNPQRWIDLYEVWR